MGHDCTCNYYFVYQEKKKPVPPRSFETKRTRRGRTEMENILFKLFERQPNWSLKQLMQETDQPEVHFPLIPPPNSIQRKHWFPTRVASLFDIRHCLQIVCTWFDICSNSWRRYWTTSVSTIKEDRIKGRTSSSLNTRSRQRTTMLHEEVLPLIRQTWVPQSRLIGTPAY